MAQECILTDSNYSFKGVSWSGQLNLYQTPNSDVTEITDSQNHFEVYNGSVDGTPASSDIFKITTVSSESYGAQNDQNELYFSFCDLSTPLTGKKITYSFFHAYASGSKTRTGVQSAITLSSILFPVKNL